MFMYSRDRQAAAHGASLGAAVAGAASLDEARALLDFEVSFGIVTENTWRIVRSTLPFRTGAMLRHAAAGSGYIRVRGHGAGGAAADRLWEIAAAEGDTSILLNGNSEKS